MSEILSFCVDYEDMGLGLNSPCPFLRWRLWNICSPDKFRDARHHEVVLKLIFPDFSGVLFHQRDVLGLRSTRYMRHGLSLLVVQLWTEHLNGELRFLPASHHK